MRYSVTAFPSPSVMLVPGLRSAISHSSRSHGPVCPTFESFGFAFSAHQLPDECHGPADHKTFPCSFSRLLCFVSADKLMGRPSSRRTRNRHGGRMILMAKAGELESSGVVELIFCGAATTNRSSRKPSGL